MANRGEIAVRVCRTLREMGIASVAVYSEADRELPFVEYADEAYAIGPGPSPPRATSAARRSSGPPSGRAPRRSIPASASWPRTRRSRAACAAAGLTFIGPLAGRDGGDGVQDRRPAGDGRRRRPDRARRDRARSRRSTRRAPRAAEIGYPVVDEGRGRRRRQGDQDRGRAATSSSRAFESAQREGKAYFADDAVYLERYLERPRHVEVQVLADLHGNVIHLGERDCSHPAPPPEDPRGDAVARRSRPSCASASARSPSTPPGRSATRTPARSRACSTPTARTTSSR